MTALANVYSKVTGPGRGVFGASLSDFRDLALRPEASREPSTGYYATEIRNSIINHDGEELRGQPIRWCDKCADRSFGIWLTVIQANGRRVAQLRCVRDGKLDRTLADRKVYPASSGPVFRNYVEDDLECERCGAESGVELHHWAPQHLFDDAWNWPMSYLCPLCHQLWHRLIKRHV